jgi:hypothetical protein
MSIQKIIGVFVCLVLVSMSISAFGTRVDVSINESRFVDPVEPPLPGMMRGDKLDLVANYDGQIGSVSKKLYASFDEGLLNLVQQLDETIYLGFLENLTSFGPRETGTEACDQAGDYIYNEFIKMGLDARLQEWSENGLSGTNVEATIHGIDEESDEIYIICAHYDSVYGSPGADDDGSGTAAVMAAAKIMSSYNFNNTVRFVAFSGEEQGLYGSYFYVQEAREENDDNIMAALNADMIGFALSEEDETNIRVFEDDYSTWITDFTSGLSQQYTGVFNLEVIPSGYSWGSDHYRFWEFGYNAVFFAEYNFNDYYHSPEDTIEHMNIPYATRVTKLIMATLAELSELQTRSAPYKPDRPSGQTGGKFNTEYTYATRSIDLQDDQILYLFDWGDETDSGWVGPFDSGSTAEASHTWTKRGSYSIKVKAKDTEGHESEWSDPLPVSMPKTKRIDYFSNRFYRLYNLVEQLISFL